MPPKSTKSKPAVINVGDRPFAIRRSGKLYLYPTLIDAIKDLKKGDMIRRLKIVESGVSSRLVSAHQEDLAKAGAEQKEAPKPPAAQKQPEKPSVAPNPANQQEVGGSNPE